MADWYKNRILVIVCDGCGSVYYVPEATACRMPCENCGLKLECHGGEYRDPASQEVIDETITTT